MKLSVLASGSSGNCYILSSDTGSLIIDPGVPWPLIQRGLNYDLSGIKGCLASHLHLDHFKAAADVMKAGIDVYANKAAIDTIRSEHMHRCHQVYINQLVRIEPFVVKPFDLQHDVMNTGYLILHRSTKELFLYITDSFYCKYRFSGINYLAIECNYIKETLDANIEAGLIDPAMKPRLLQSHFSLENVKGFLKANDLSQCRKIILLHLSAGNSNAAKMVREIREQTGIDTVVADPGLEVDLELYPY